MDEKVFSYIREQIDYLKADLEREVPLNMDSEFQPEAAAKIYALRDQTRRQIMELLSKLAGGAPAQDDRQDIREMLERLANDRSSMEMATKAISEMDKDEYRIELIREVCTLYESTKKEIATKLIEKLC